MSLSEKFSIGLRKLKACSALNDLWEIKTNLNNVYL